MDRLLIVGCGDVARRALPWLARRFRVYATVRGEGDAAGLRAFGVTPIPGDLDRPGTLRRLPGIARLILYTAPPQPRGARDERLRRLLAALAGARSSLPRRIVYIGTTGVYGDCRGASVAETRPVAPQTARARRRLDAERVLRRFGRRCGVAVSILRCPGIYAADRLPVERIRRGEPVLREADDVFSNHIHAEDLARACALALFRARSGRIYNACDDTRCRMGDYFDLVARAFGLPCPPRVAREEAGRHLSPMTMSFMAESRRLDNTRIKRELRLRLRYPDVHAGLAAARGSETASEVSSCSP
ncbi:MAG: NAD-binding protein [Rhodocyclaceae bacterium]